MKRMMIIMLIAIIGLYGCGTEDNPAGLDISAKDSVLVLEEDEHLHDHSVEIEGKDMRMLTIRQVAELWEIDEQELLDAIITEFSFTNSYTEDTVLEEMRQEYKFSPAIIKDLAEDIKSRQGV